jgi:predicted RNA-binding Zn-ribbon protein involved in translation (DUF1610 family)
VTKAQCPSCGGPVEFAIGSSVVVVCDYCRTIVARGDRGIEDHGKVAGLIDTGSRLRVHAAGKYGGVGFRITGRTQLRHQAGGTWDEWYAAFDDGRWAWIAEAQGRYYVTVKSDATAPPSYNLELGGRLLGLTVTEIGTAMLASAEGELPWRPTPGYSYDYADLTGANREFATIDYSEDPPVVFLGREVSLRELGVEGEAVRDTRIKVEKLSCVKCGGPLELRAPDQAERIYCPNCGSAHDVERGNLRYLQTLKTGKAVKPVIPLGSKGTIDDHEYVIAGFMQRAVKFDILYYWTEYLLFNEQQGFRWLVHSDNHWSFVTPLRAGEVLDPSPNGVAKHIRYDGHSYRLFQDATARVTSVLGEFYWRVTVGESVDTVDYVRPPFGISKEITREGAQEINYSHARYMTTKEVEKAFGVENLQRPSMVGPIQPFNGVKLGGPWALMLLLLFAVTIYIAATKPRRVLVNRVFDVAEAPLPADATEMERNARVLFTDPFELSGTENISVQGNADVSNSWMYVSGDLVNEATGELLDFELPIEFYSGVDGGERWSEGKRNRSAFLARPEKGTYVLRLETQWEPGKIPPKLHIVVREGVFRILHFVLALIAISIFPALAILRQISFETQRWKDSAHSPFGQWTTEDDDE